MFEYDKNKSEQNYQKHGISFEDSYSLWEDSDRLLLSARSETEDRYLLIGQINGKHWSAIITFRENNTRIISVRRSRKNEVEAYESRRIG